MKDLDTLGKRIRAARNHANLTQTDLADRLDTIIRQIQRWEADQHEPAASAIGKIASATGVTVNFLLGDFPRMPTTWAPLTVVPTSSDTPHTPDEATRLLGQATGEERDVDDVTDAIRAGWIEWLDGALVEWQDGDRSEEADLLYKMLVK